MHQRNVLYCYYRMLFKNPLKSVLHSLNGGGIILTFDDHFVTEWYDADMTLSRYQWKATFFISEFASLDAKDVDRLRSLQAKGHEIGLHGANHMNAVDFVSLHSIEQYIEAEILPSVQTMTAEGLIVNSFAYPNGAWTKKIDRALQNHFTMRRGTAYWKKPPKKHRNYANGSRLVFGLGIDRSYGNDIGYILEMLKYAKDSNKIAIFYGHNIQTDDSLKFVTNVQTLEEICKYVVANNMRFMTLKELVTT